MGDVSARSGVTPSEAEQALQALAADAQGTLQVSRNALAHLRRSHNRGTSHLGARGSVGMVPCCLADIAVFVSCTYVSHPHLTRAHSMAFPLPCLNILCCRRCPMRATCCMCCRAASEGTSRRAPGGCVPSPPSSGYGTSCRSAAGGHDTGCLTIRQDPPPSSRIGLQHGSTPCHAPYRLQVVGTANYLARVAFGAALVTSVAVVWLAIIAILSSANSDRDDRCRSRPVCKHCKT